MMRLHEISLRTVRLPLIRPYVLSYRTFTEFEPISVEVRDGDGRVGWGEGHISPGSSSETREGGWAFCREHAQAVVGKDTGAAKAMIGAHAGASKVAATALITAIEMLEDHPALRIEREARLPLLTPFNSSAPEEIAAEVERRLEEGFRTFKIKVGKDADADARRVTAIQQAIAGPAPGGSGGPPPAAPPSGSTQTAGLARTTRAGLRPRSIPPASNCSSSRARPTTGTPTPRPRRCRRCR